MSIFFRYISREIVKSAAVVAVVVITVYLAVDFFGKIDNFMEADLPPAVALVFFGLKIPFIVVQMMPVAVLIAVLLVFGLMKKNNEIIVIKTSGLSVGSLLAPAAAVGAGASLLLFLVSEMVVPVTTGQANQIWLQKVRQKTSTLQKRSDIWLKDEQVILYIRHYDPAEQKVFGITVNYIGENFQIKRRIDARRGVYTNNTWILQDLMDSRFGKKGNLVRSDVKRRLTVDLSIMPEDLGRAVKSTKEMGFVELLHHIEELKSEGYSVATYRTDLHAKISFSVVCLLMSIFATGLALSGRSRGDITANIAYGIGTSFIYWIFYSFCLSLGYGGILPPLVAAWTANIVFLLAGGLMVIRAA